MDNWHTIIVLSLIAFGIGHAVFCRRHWVWAFLLVIIFLVPIYLSFFNTLSYGVAILSFVFGIAYARRHAVLNISDGVSDIFSSILGVFSKNQIDDDNKSHNNQGTYSHHGEHSSNHNARAKEQVRREEEVKSQRAEQQRQDNKTEDTKGSAQADEQTHSDSQRNYDESVKSKSVSKPETGESRSNLEILGLKEGFTSDELKTAYKRESARCHPDKWMNKPEAIQKIMEQEMKLINRAYELLK